MNKTGKLLVIVQAGLMGIWPFIMLFFPHIFENVNKKV